MRMRNVRGTPPTRATSTRRFAPAPARMPPTEPTVGGVVSFVARRVVFLTSEAALAAWAAVTVHVAAPVVYTVSVAAALEAGGCSC